MEEGPEHVGNEPERHTSAHTVTSSRSTPTSINHEVTKIKK